MLLPHAKRQGYPQREFWVKKQSKKLISLLLLGLLVLGMGLFTGCSGDKENGEELESAQIEKAEGSDDQRGESDQSEDGSSESSSSGDSGSSTNSTGDPSSQGESTSAGSVRTVDDGDVLVLVNRDNPVSEDYYPTDMVTIDGSLSTNQNLVVKREAYEAYKKMLADAQAAGLNFAICSAYRSYDLQKSLYDNSLAANGFDYTDKMFAYPGNSEHHTGWAIDITSASMNWGLSQDFADYPDGAWITEHCSEYGFILRYLKGKEDITGYMYEPWHIRYVGLDVAKEITEKGITLEEYLGVA